MSDYANYPFAHAAHMAAWIRITGADAQEINDEFAALKALAVQYRDDLRRPVTDPDSLKRRLEAIDAALSDEPPKTAEIL